MKYMMNIIRMISMVKHITPLPTGRGRGEGLLLFLVLLFSSCEKEISVDYRQVAQLYVAEGLVTQSGTAAATNRTSKPTHVRLTTTQDMTDNQTNSHNVANATVVLSEDGNVIDTLRYWRNGYYVSDCLGMEGASYTLDIYLDGHHFQSTSTMQAAPQFSSFRFVWKDVLTERMLFGDLKIDDIKGQNNCYFMHMYRNGVGYRWAVMDDTHNPGGELQQLFSCTTERNLDKDDDDGLKDGDKILLEVRSIDRRTYDYFYSMQVMQNSGTNPVQNFTGGCLGYFSACNVYTYQTTFRRAEIETE